MYIYMYVYIYIIYILYIYTFPDSQIIQSYVSVSMKSLFTTSLHTNTFHLRKLSTHSERYYTLVGSPFTLT